MVRRIPELLTTASEPGDPHQENRVGGLHRHVGRDHGFSRWGDGTQRVPLEAKLWPPCKRLHRKTILYCTRSGEGATGLAILDAEVLRAPGRDASSPLA